MSARKLTGNLLAIVTMLAAFLFIVGGVLSWQAHADSGYTTDNFDVHVKVNKNYTYDYTEKITVNFLEPRHGIYVDIPQGAGYRIKDISVQGDAYQLSEEDGSQIIRIGDPDRYVEGERSYTITYTIVCIERSSVINDMYIDLFPSGWQTDVGHVSITMDLPKDLKLKDIHTYASEYGDTGDSIGTWDTDLSDHRITYEADNFPSYTGVTLRAGVPDNYWVGAKNIEWTNWLSMIILVLSIAAVIFMRLRYGRNPSIVEPVEFYPPDDMNPTEIGYMIDGNVDQKDLTSMFFYMASKGYCKINQVEEKKFEFIKLKNPEPGCERAVERFFKGMFGGKAYEREEGYTVSMEDMGTRMGSAFDAIKNITQDSFTGDRRLTSESSETADTITGGIYFVVVAALTLISMFRDGDFQQSVIGPLFAGFIAAAVLTALAYKFKAVHNYRYSRKGASQVTRYIIWGIIYYIVCTVYAGMIGGDIIGNTETKVVILLYIFLVVAPIMLIGMVSRTEWSAGMFGRILGFRNFIRDAELQKLEELVEQDPDYFYNILPYAYVLGLTKKWASNFEGIELKQPDWYVADSIGTNTMFNAMLMNSMMTNMAASATRDIIVKSADKGGGSWGSGGGGWSGGGGFSGGGGGFSGGGVGGGGGGAW